MRSLLVLLLAPVFLCAQSQNYESIPGNQQVTPESPYSSFSQLPQDVYWRKLSPDGSYDNPYPTPMYPYSYPTYGGSSYNGYPNRYPGYGQGAQRRYGQEDQHPMMAPRGGRGR